MTRVKYCENEFGGHPCPELMPSSSANSFEDDEFDKEYKSRSLEKASNESLFPCDDCQKYSCPYNFAEEETTNKITSLNFLMAMLAIFDLCILWPRLSDEIVRKQSIPPEDTSLRRKNFFSLIRQTLALQLTSAATILSSGSIGGILIQYDSQDKTREELDDMHICSDHCTAKNIILSWKDFAHIALVCALAANSCYEAGRNANVFCWKSFRAQRNTREKNGKCYCRPRIRKKDARAREEGVAFACYAFIFLLIVPIITNHHTKHVDYSNLVVTPGKRSGTKLISPLEVLILRILDAVNSGALLHLRTKVRASLLSTLKRLSGFAVKNPTVFLTACRKVILAIRWAKFVTPLLVTCNKLRAHMKDMLEKRRQLRRAKKARHTWNCVLGKIAPKGMVETAAIKIQTNFRSKRDRLALFIIMVMKERKEQHSLQKIHAWMKAWAAHSRAKIARKKAMCEKIQAQKNLQLQQVSAEDHHHISKMKKSILEYNLRKTKKLLRPNTKFSVSWRCITAACVLLEVLQIALAPTLTGDIEKVPVDMLLGRILGSPVNCTTSGNEYGRSNIFALSLVNLWSKTSKKSNWRELESCITSSSLTKVRAVVTRFLTNNIVYIVGTTCFLDVFITFFTGEVDCKTGKLVPKPFFKRWLMPGVALQMVVNPRMGGIVTFLRLSLRALGSAGPMCVVHALLALAPSIWFIADNIFVLACRLVTRYNDRKKWCIFNK